MNDLINDLGNVLHEDLHKAFFRVTYNDHQRTLYGIDDVLGVLRGEISIHSASLRAAGRRMGEVTTAKVWDVVENEDGTYNLSPLIPDPFWGAMVVREPIKTDSDFLN